MANSSWLSDVKFHNDPALPEDTAIRALFVGPSNCGKTRLMFKWVISGLLDYNRLYIFSNSINQSLYRLLIYGFNKGLTKRELMALFGKIDSISHLSPEEVVDNMVNEKLFMKIVTKKEDKVECFATSDCKKIKSPEEYDKNYKNLFIFDDCMFDLKVKNIINNFFTRGRHQNFQVIFLAQDYFQTCKGGVRSNANVFVLFRLSDVDRRNIYTSIASSDFKTIKEFNDLCDTIWAEKY